MKRKTLAALACASALVGLASPAHAQLAVIDSASLAKQVEMVKNSVTQIQKLTEQVQEAQRLYDSVNNITDVGDIASALNSDAIRKGLPSDLQGAVKLTSTNLSELGSIGDRAKSLLSSNGLSEGLDGATEVLKSAANFAARDQAVAEYGLEVADKTDEGLSQLKQRLSTAATAKETADLQARATLEVAQLLNQANQRAALKDAQLQATRLKGLAEDAERRRAADARGKSGKILPTFN